MSANAHDRMAVRRRDQAWLDERWDDPHTRVLVVSNARVRPVDGLIDWVSPARAPAGQRLLLGDRDGSVCFALLADPDVRAQLTAQGHEDEGWQPLRSILPLLVAGPSTDATLVLHAMGIAEWLQVTRFCPRCGGRLGARSAGHEMVCADCGRSQFPRTDPAVIMAVTVGEPGAEDERCLLGHQSRWPKGRYSTLAGFCEPGETLEDAVRREVLEEVGIHVADVDYFGNQPWPLPASLMVGFSARAISEDISVDDDEIEDARWFTRAQMRAEAESGALMLPGGVSISRSLIENWYGGALPGQW